MENIILAVFFSSCIIVTFRLFTRLRIDNLQAITVNYFAAAILSFLAHGQEFAFTQLVYRSWFPWAVANGFLFIVVFLVFAHSAQKAGVAITAVASKMSVIIPVTIGLMIYGDSINTFKIAGILSAFPAFFLIFYKRKKLEGDTKYWFLPLILFLGTGANDSVMKHARMYFVGDEYLLFLGTIFFLALVIGLIVIFSGLATRVPKSLTLKNIIAGLILGYFNYSSTMYFLRSIAVFESSVFFPIFNVSIVSMGALIGWLVFRENLNLKNWLGILLAIVTILLIAFS